VPCRDADPAPPQILSTKLRIAHDLLDVVLKISVRRMENLTAQRPDGCDILEPLVYAALDESIPPAEQPHVPIARPLTVP
jgi:hypothetical protein